MCGIAGYLGPEDRFGDDAIARMLDSIAHRGPDDSGFLSRPAGRAGQRVWIGNRRLAIQDLSPAGHQPRVDRETGNAIVFNGEVFNFPDLRAELIGRGDRFESRCDTEVILRSWCHEGLAAVGRWRGMFGAAIWDDGAQELWLVRDHWGIKPLYYWTDGEALLFCSEVRGLLATGMVPRRLSRRGIQDYLTYGAVQDPVTIIDGVYALLPGHALRCRPGRIEVAVCPETEGVPEDRGAEAIEPMLREIVRQQLVADVPVAVFLSGGVDSSVVSLLARQEIGSGLNTITLGFEEARYSEAVFARKVADHIGTAHHEVLLRRSDVFASAVEAIACMDQPSVDGINTYVVSGAARRLGFPVVLSGMGGDEFFGGYHTFRRTPLMANVVRMAQTAPPLARTAARVLRPAFNRMGRAAIKLAQYLEHGDFTEHPYFLQRMQLFPSQIAGLCRGGVPSAQADQMAEERFRWLLETAAPMDPLNQICYFEARAYMGNMLLRDSDQMSMAHSLEMRVPLVDQVLAAYLLRIASSRKGFADGSKLWLRRIFGPQLPREVFERRKMGFTLPFAVWLRGPLRAQVQSTLEANPAELWDRDLALRLWREFLAGKLDWTRPWALYVLSRWAAQHIEGSRVDDLRLAPAGA